MKKYLSFGGGVNSVAMMLMLLDQKEDFEAIFVDHGTDWPETYEYFEMFQEWLIENGHKPITVLKPNVQGYENLYKYYWDNKWVPSFMARICTDKFKIRPIHKYVEKPCFMLLGIDYGEIKRAKISTNKGTENRYPLIEVEINREGCKQIIADHGLPIPMKSGCYICPYQKKTQWVELRKKHPGLFCKATSMEKRNMDERIRINTELKLIALKYAHVIPAIMVLSLFEGRKVFTLSASKKTISAMVEETQQNLFEQDDYPPCQCGL